MRSKATYLYCLVRASRPRLRGNAAGLPGFGKPRLLGAGGELWLVVADAPLPRYGEAGIARGLRDLAWVSKCAMAHEAVVEGWLGARAVAPLKLFTIFEGDEKALSYVRRQRATLDRVLERISGRWEWGVRVRYAGVPPPARRPARSRGGAGYLAQKQRAWAAVRDRAARGGARADAAFAALAAGASEAERRPPPAEGRVASNLLLDATFLVDASAGRHFRAAARRVARDLKGEGYSVEITGPWPPYNFVEL